MNQLNTFVCIKPTCNDAYETEEVEAYYCPKCLKEKEAIAKKVDAQMAARGKREPVSAVKQYEAQKQRYGNQIGVRVKI